MPSPPSSPQRSPSPSALRAHMKLSFSLFRGSKPSLRSAEVAVADHHEEENPTPNPSPQFVTNFDPAPPTDAALSRPVIPPLPDTFHQRRMSLGRPCLYDVVRGRGSPMVSLEEAASSADEPNESVYGLNLRQSATAARHRSAVVETDASVRHYRRDMETLPDHRGQEEYKFISTEDFGRAVLAGYGWQEGKGVGSNKDKEDIFVGVEYERRNLGTYGLGFKPASCRPCNYHNRAQVRESDRGASR